MDREPTTPGAAPTGRPRWKLCCLACIACLGLAALAGVALIWAIGSDIEAEERRTFPEIARFDSIEPGMTEQQVRHLVGEPGEVHEKDAAPQDYYVEGYTYERRPITNKVFIYWYGSDHIAYIWFDPSNRVEHVYLGGS